MSNWVRNNVTITKVDKATIEIKEFCSLIDCDVNKDYTLNSVIPGPTYPHFNNEEIGLEHILSDERYQWRCSNWGVKWDEIIIPKGTFSGIDKLDQISLSFDTPWSSPMFVLIRLSQLLGEDYDVAVEATDEFLGNHVDYNLKINNGEVTELPIEIDYETWWNSVWGLEDYDFDDDGSVEFISSTDVANKVNNHSDNLDEGLQSLLLNEIADSDSTFVDTGEDTLWEMETENFIITANFYLEKHLMLDSIVVYKPTNQPVAVLPITASFIATKLSRVILEKES